MMKEISSVSDKSLTMLAASANVNGNNLSVKGSAKSGKTDFDSYMNSGVNNTGANNAAADKTAVKGTAKEVTTADNSSKVAAKKETVADMSKTVSDNKVVGDAETVEAVSDAIYETVKDALDIDDATLSSIMTALEIVPLDLLNQNNLQQLVVMADGGDDITDLLTDNVMMTDFMNLADALESMDWEDLTGMTKEDFTAALGEALGADADELLSSQNFDDVLAGEEVTAKTSEVVYEVESGVAAQSAVKEDAAVQNVSKDTTVADTSDNDHVVVAAVSEDVKADADSSNDNSNQSAFAEDAQVETVVLRREDTVRPENVVRTDFMNNLVQAAEGLSEVTGVEQSNMQQMVDIVNQIVDKIKVTMGKEMTSMELQLNPQNLGKVLISVSAKNGIMTANFTVQTEEARQAVESQLYSLREALEVKELKVDAVEVQVSDFAFSQSRQSNGQDAKEFSQGDGKRKRFEFDDGEDDNNSTSADTAVSASRMGIAGMGTSVDFTA